MNKTYRSIWNEALGAWVATSELPSRRGKAARSVRGLKAAAVGLTLGALMPMAAWAQAAGGGVVASGTNGTAASDTGCAAPATVSAFQGIAVGCGATAGSSNGIAVGAGSLTINPGDVSVGNGAGQGATPLSPAAEPNVFIGTRAGASSSQGGGVAIGLRAGQGLVGYNNLMFGYQAGINSNGSYNVGVGANSASEVLGMRLGVGTFKGESAVGISFRRTSDNNAWSLTGGVATSRAGVGATVGAEWVFN